MSTLPPTRADTGEEFAIFDEAELMRRLLDDRDLVNLIMGAFIEDIPLQLARLKQFMLDGNAEGVTRQAHTIKGASANLSALALSHAAARVEELSKNGEPAAAAKMIPQIESEFERFRKVVER
jgi:two-component system sensor histidine kinase/response regulator